MLSGSTVEELQARGAELFGKGDYEGAVSEYRKLVELAPTSATALKSLGLALVRARQIEEGIEICSKAAFLQPTDAEVRYAYGYALGSAQRFSEATEHLDAALSLQPNHLPAKQALVYSLLTQGQHILQQDDPYAAERYFDRAHKIDGKNPEITGALMNAYYLTQQKGKLLKLYQELNANEREHAAIQPVVARMQADSDYQVALKQASYSSASGGPAKPATQAIQQVPCPNCRQMIMDWAAVCPHCNFKIRAIGTFAGRDTGPKYAWQDVAYTIVAMLWCLSAGWDVFAASQIKDEAFRVPMIILTGGTLGVGLGLLFRVEWIAFIAKIMCYLRLLLSSAGLMLAFGERKPVDMWVNFSINLASLIIVGFMIYLINYVTGE